ncbi:MAG TPA: hypothetical protein VGD56_09905, partial [Gemmatirosa sp.]
MRGVLQDLARATASTRGARDSARSRATGGATAPASGGALQIVEQHVEGSDSLARAFDITPADTGVTLGQVAGACGVARACVPGWALRVTHVALPGPLLPVGARIVVTTAVENHGRQPAPASELRFCFAGGLFGRGAPGCGTAHVLDVAPVPPLAPGARAVVRHV